MRVASAPVRLNWAMAELMSSAASATSMPSDAARSECAVQAAERMSDVLMPALPSSLIASARVRGGVHGVGAGVDGGLAQQGHLVGAGSGVGLDGRHAGVEVGGHARRRRPMRWRRFRRRRFRRSGASSCRPTPPWWWRSSRPRRTPWPCRR